jgi:multidrug efflux pump subunit AcrA (membrane-fusion protein)
MNHLKIVPLLGLLFLVPSCNRKGEDAVSSSEEEAEQPTNRIAIPATVSSNLGITFAKVERRNVENTVRVPGSFELQPLAKHEYRMMLPGHVEFLVNQFDEVKAGTPVYRFRSLRLLDLQQRVDLAQASLRQAKVKYEVAITRKRALAKADFKRADLDAQVAELEAEIDQREAEQTAASAALRNASQSSGRENPASKADASDWIEVRAKESGFVESLAVTNGTFVEETSLILTTVDPTKVRFHAMGLQSDLPKFENGQSVNIVLPQGIGNDLNESIEATLQIALTADPEQRTVGLFAMPGELKSWARPGVSAFLDENAKVVARLDDAEGEFTNADGDGLIAGTATHIRDHGEEDGERDDGLQGVFVGSDDAGGEKIEKDVWSQPGEATGAAVPERHGAEFFTSDVEILHVGVGVFLGFVIKVGEDI